MTEETKTQNDEKQTETGEQNETQSDSTSKAAKKKVTKKKSTKKVTPKKKSPKKKPAKKKNADSDGLVEVPGDEFNKMVVGAKRNATNDDDMRFAASFKQTPHPEVTIKEEHAERLRSLADMVADVEGDDEEE